MNREINRQEEILGLFPEAMRGMWNMAAMQMEQMQEIRLRTGQPVILYMRQKEWFREKTEGLLLIKKRRIA